MFNLEKIADEEYRKIGRLNIQEPTQLVLNASTCKDIYDRGLYDVLLEDVEHTEETLINFKIGTEVHSCILEPSDFQKKYYIGRFNPLEERNQLKDTEFVEKTKKQISLKFPNILNEIGAELTITGEIEGVNVKAKIDKIEVDNANNRIYVYDLKSTGLPMLKIKKGRDGKAWEIAKTISEYHYDLQMYFYSLLIELYFEQVGKRFEIIPILVFASKTDFKVRQVRLSPETIGAGEEKFKEVFRDIKDFVNYGIKAVEKDILI